MTENTRLIPLTQGRFAIVDAADYEWLMQWNWHMGTHYATRKGRKYAEEPTKVLMHRVITAAPNDMQVDHINGNRLDNRRVNLRIVTSRENNWNAGTRRDSKSGVRGVCPCSKGWQAYISVNGRRRVLGTFATLGEAAQVRKVAEQHYYGEYARKVSP